jgi:hypothetical protein
MSPFHLWETLAAVQLLLMSNGAVLEITGAQNPHLTSQRMIQFLFGENDAVNVCWK